MGKPTERERFWAKVDVSIWKDDCWPWLGARTAEGYGYFWRASGKHVKAHRFAYEDAVGPIPHGMQLDHLCRSPSCVRPDHLEPVSNGENVRRSSATKLTAEIVDLILASDEMNIELAPKLGLHHSTVARVRTGEKSWPASRARAVAR